MPKLIFFPKCFWRHIFLFVCLCIIVLHIRLFIKTKQKQNKLHLYIVQNTFEWHQSVNKAKSVFFIMFPENKSHHPFNFKIFSIPFTSLASWLHGLWAYCVRKIKLSVFLGGGWAGVLLPRKYVRGTFTETLGVYGSPWEFWNSPSFRGDFPNFDSAIFSTAAPCEACVPFGSNLLLKSRYAKIIWTTVRHIVYKLSSVQILLFPTDFQNYDAKFVSFQCEFNMQFGTESKVSRIFQIICLDKLRWLTWIILFLNYSKFVNKVY